MFRLVLVVLALVGASHAQTHSRGYGSYGYYSRADEALLDDAVRLIESVESKEAAQLNRLERLTVSTNQNLDLWNNFYQFTHQAILDKQAEQNERLASLAVRIAEIAALRATVKSLHQEAQGIRNTIDNQIYPAREQFMLDINGLQNQDIIRAGQIEAVRTRTYNINARIDNLFVKAWANTKALDVASKDVKMIFDSINKVRAAQYSLSQEPTTAQGATSQDFTPAFNGQPQARTFSVTGFHFEKGYGHGYPSLYFGHESNVWNNGYDSFVRDASFGGWVTSIVHSQASFIYFDSTVLVSCA